MKNFREKKFWKSGGITIDNPPLQTLFRVLKGGVIFTIFLVHFWRGGVFLEIYKFCLCFFQIQSICFFFLLFCCFFFSISDQKWTKNWKFGWHIFKSPQIYKQFQNLNRINDNLSNLRQKYTRKLSSLVNIKIMQKSWEKNVFLKGGLFKTTFYFSCFWRGGYP